MDKNLAYIFNLNYSPDFSTPVYDGLLWQPVKSIGISRYTYKDIKKISFLKPETKRRVISNLCEAIQLFVVSEFTNELDIINIKEKEIVWEHHKPGFYSVLTNKGCCSSMASWLAYILEGKYEEIGIIIVGVNSGSGHAFNYIRKAGYYYVVDLYAYISANIDEIAKETGNILDFRRGKYITGLLLKCKSLEVFAKYFQDFHRLKLGNSLVFSLKDTKCPASACYKTQNNMKFLFPEGTRIFSLGKKGSREVSFDFIEGPTVFPNWEAVVDKKS